MRVKLVLAPFGLYLSAGPFGDAISRQAQTQEIARLGKWLQSAVADYGHYSGKRWDVRSTLLIEGCRAVLLQRHSWAPEYDPSLSVTLKGSSRNDSTVFLLGSVGTVTPVISRIIKGDSGARYFAPPEGISFPSADGLRSFTTIQVVPGSRSAETKREASLTVHLEANAVEDVVDVAKRLVRLCGGGKRRVP